ncbi:MAG: hypothetical protein OXU20_00580 [Myxococcales bacterium]|nr:hypothetical protein [Myxococcales bacterium]
MNTSEQTVSVLLATANPALANALRDGLVSVGEHALADSIGALRVTGRCQCGQADCGTFYAKPRGEWLGQQLKQLLPDVPGLEAIDTLDGEIVCVEFLGRDDVVAFLDRHLGQVPPRASLPSEINNWDVEHDPYGYLRSDDWGELVDEEEDILQLAHVWGDLTLDVGHYGQGFVVQVIRSAGWEHPVERHEVSQRGELVGAVDALAIKYANPSADR